MFDFYWFIYYMFEEQYLNNTQISSLWKWVYGGGKIMKKILGNNQVVLLFSLSLMVH